MEPSRIQNMMYTVDIPSITKYAFVTILKTSRVRAWPNLDLALTRLELILS